MNEMQLERQSIDPSRLIQRFEKHLGRDVAKVSVTQLAGDASSRRYFRIVSKNGDKKSFILQESDSFDAQSFDKHSFLTGHRNLATVSLPVPQILGTFPEKGWILLEDLGDETLQSHVTDELYEQAIDLLIEWTVKLHPKNPELPADVKKSPQFSWAFDFEKLNFEMGFTAEHLFKKLLQNPDHLEFLKRTEKNTRYLVDVPRFYCHRDYHCRNLMFHEGKLFLIDFQDARMGPITYDIVSLLWDPYVRLSEDRRERFLNYWFEKLCTRIKDKKIAAYISPLAKNWRLELERMKIQRLLKAAGSYASFYNNKGRMDYLPSIDPALKDVRTSFDTIERDFPAEFSTDDQRLREFVRWAQVEYAAEAGSFK